MSGSNPAGATGGLETPRTASGRAVAAGGDPESAVDPQTGPIGSWGVRGLVVRYGHHVALDAVDLEVPAGSVTAVVGADHLFRGVVWPQSGLRRVRFGAPTGATSDTLPPTGACTGT